MRSNFPVTIHQNHTLEGEPRSLCLYAQPWEVIERVWTPELFIGRIFWWLRETANGTIHAEDQPIEAIFFSSFTNVVLPVGFFEHDESERRNLIFSSVQNAQVRTHTLVGRFADSNPSKDQVGIKCVPVSLLLAPVENGPIEAYPHSLSQLQSLIQSRGSSILGPLKDAIGQLVPEEGVSFGGSDKELILFILGIPRSRDGVVERLEVQGFIAQTDIGNLGESLSVLLRAPDDNKWYRDIAGGGGNDHWRNIRIDPVNIKTYPTPNEIRRYSGLEADEEGPRGLIAGVGALGSALAQIWNRECWGRWQYADDDLVQPHNIVRHVAGCNAIGFPKSMVVDSLLGDIHSPDNERLTDHFVENVLSIHRKLQKALADGELIVDATTTLHVPRELSKRDGVARTASVFFTPSGMASVLILENRDRTIRCSTLEAQYYRAILNSDWGDGHLTGHYGKQWVGAGCRDATVEMSVELVQLHAATLARQLRKSTAVSRARVCIWEYKDNSGALIPHDVPVFDSTSAQIGGWKVSWDNGFLGEAIEKRNEKLPNETGGILLAVIDQKDQTIVLVKAADEPLNSVSSPSGFIRAGYDATEILDRCHQKTAGVVTYAGEWHSHPVGCSALPSGDDINQLNFVTQALQTEGLPALMMIVSDDSVGFYLKGEGCISSLPNT